ncbi:MAG TPA: archaellin/type IV pilin N-terminal domain-containing protein [Candidatus Acidoferrales bacterium]|nr:archaellin/type IV pilin N-terminal domain-containing protein [Candidatus Acidoferrales bacterium]
MKFKLRRTLRGNVKAVSPVIATIIIVAIAITMSIAVAYWLLGLGSSFTKFEKVEFATAYTDAGIGNYTVTMTLKNTGSATATINAADVLYNGKPAVAYTTYAPVANFTQIVLQPGETSGARLSLLNSGSSNWVSGMTVEITLHTAGGKDYPKVITLP